MLRRVVAPVAGLMLAALVAGPSSGAPVTTLVRTIQDTDGDDRLDYASGEDYTVFGAPAGFVPPNRSIVNFLQMTDFQMVDEESPARVEFLDTTQRAPGAQPFAAAYRPQESTTTQITEAMVRAARDTVSPITQEPPALTMLTGDNADSQQFNETRWFIDVLDGTVGSAADIDPNSGRPEEACSANPDGGFPGGEYHGVQGGGRLGYYDPDASDPGTDDTDGDGYSPDAADNEEETGRRVTVRDYPGLLDAAQQNFEAVGLGMPWYSAFGNHDALVQGNSPDAYLGPTGPGAGTAPPDAVEDSNEVYQGIATGCIKPSNALQRTLLEEGLADGHLDRTELRAIASRAPADETNPLIVPPDLRRCFLAKDEPDPSAPGPCSREGWIGQHFLTSGEPVGHGFAAAAELGAEQQQAGYGRPPVADRNDDGYYSFSPTPGLRFVVLDSVTDECVAPLVFPFCSEGSIDDPQFRWLEDQIATAADMGEYVMVFSHHTLRTTRSPSDDPTEQPLHFGQRVDPENPSSPQPPSPGETLQELYCRSPNVLAHVDGHEHENSIRHHDCSSVLGDPNSPAVDDLWEISTAAHIDWPQQSRMIELIDNVNGTMSLVLTMLDHGGPADPGGAPPERLGQGDSGEQVLKLASIGRELAYNDYQNARSSRGDREDRNAIIVLDRPWPYPTDH